MPPIQNNKSKLFQGSQYSFYFYNSFTTFSDPLNDRFDRANGWLGKELDADRRTLISQTMPWQGVARIYNFSCSCAYATFLACLSADNNRTVWAEVFSSNMSEVDPVTGRVTAIAADHADSRGGLLFGRSGQLHYILADCECPI